MQKNKALLWKFSFRQTSNQALAHLQPRCLSSEMHFPDQAQNVNAHGKRRIKIALDRLTAERPDWGKVKRKEHIFETIQSHFSIILYHSEYYLSSSFEKNFLKKPKNPLKPVGFSGLIQNCSYEPLRITNILYHIDFDLSIVFEKMWFL